MPVQSVIELPRDQYRHPEAPAEWWWHIGSLKAGDRLFGFEINATGGTAPNTQTLYGFSQIMVSDVRNGQHYQCSTLFQPSADWAQSDPAKPWSVSLGSDPAASGSIRMTSAPANWWTMAVSARALDAVSGVSIGLDLTLSQNGAPLLAWGAGVKRGVDPSGKNPFERDNFYYSLTRLDARGQLAIGTETFAVTGLTWMDHEYGAFSSAFRWVLQDAQLENGVHLENFTSNDYIPQLNVPTPSQTTVLWPDGDCGVLESVTTPLAPIWRNSEGGIYFLRYRVDIAGLNAQIVFTATIADQEFRSLPNVPNSNPIYEGNAFVDGTFEGAAVSGLGWIEQSIGVDNPG